MDKPAALVLARVRGRPLAAKPDLVSLLRCRWAPGCAFAAPWVARVAAGVAAALAHLHSLGVSQRPVYYYGRDGQAWVARATSMWTYGLSFMSSKLSVRRAPAVASPLRSPTCTASG